jgi:hypothetical protein
MEDYVADLVVIWQLEDYVTVDDVNILYVKNMSYSESYKYRQRGLEHDLIQPKHV